MLDCSFFKLLVEVEPASFLYKLMHDAQTGMAIARYQNVECDSSRPQGAQEGLTVWFTGLSGSGKTTLCHSISLRLKDKGLKVEILDGDVLRKELSPELGFSRREREQNVRRIGYVAQLLSRYGVIVLVAAISPYRASRDETRKRIGRFIEVHVNAPLAVCEQRDPKGLYKQARAGLVLNFTGVDDPYEVPLAPDVLCNTHQEDICQSTEKVLAAIMMLYEPNSHERFNSVS